jgi:hypothetical protein
MTNNNVNDIETPNLDSNSIQDNVDFGIDTRRDRRLRVTKRDKQQSWRRNAIMKAMVQGVTNSYDLARLMSISQSTAYRDVQWLKSQSAKELQYHVQERIPWSNKVFSEGILEVLRYAWSLVLEQDNKASKIATLALILQCYRDVSTNASVITEAMNEVERMKQQVLNYSSITKADAKEVITEGGDK